MFGIVINEEGYKVEFVVLNENKTPQVYTLKDGEQVIEKDWQIANSMIKPKWTGTDWIEGATEEEIKEWQERNKPQPQEPTDIEILQKQMTQLIINQL